MVIRKWVQDEVLFLLVHNKLPVRERLHRIQQAPDPYCTLCLEQSGAVICDVGHVFCSCLRIEKMWNAVRKLVSTLLCINDDEVCDSNILRLNLSVNNCPGVIWLMGAYVSAVWKARGSGHLNEAELFGFLKFKFRSSRLGTVEQIETTSKILDSSQFK